MESILIMCSFLLCLICLCLILNQLNKYILKIESTKLNDSTSEKRLNEIIIDPIIKENKLKINIEKSTLTYPTESQNKFAFKIFKYFSEKKKGLVKFNTFILLSKFYNYLK